MTQVEVQGPVVPTAPEDRAGIWVVVPTYNEAANLETMATAILAAVPEAHLLVVDDGSPDGTGLIADGLAAHDPRVRVLHRATKEGLGPAYLAGFAVALGEGAEVVVQMDADGSHDPRVLRQLVRPVVDGEADLVLGSRYVPGGGAVDWPWRRRLISRAGSLYARTVLGLPIHDLTGGFKAWRGGLLRSIDAAGIRAGGYVFQIEMTCRAVEHGARVLEWPIVFRDRRYGSSKMSSRIVLEAMVLVLRLGLERRTRARPRPAPAP